MKFNRLASGALASVVLFGSIGTAVINPEASLAKPSANSTQPTTQTVLARGSFVNVEQGHPTSGAVRIVTENEQRYLEFEQGFKTTNGPDVKVILHRDSIVPLNVNEQDYITLAPIQSLSGAQRYALPADLNLEQFQSVAIWCEQFNVTFGYANLR